MYASEDTTPHAVRRAHQYQKQTNKNRVAQVRCAAQTSNSRPVKFIAKRSAISGNRRDYRQATGEGISYKIKSFSWNDFSIIFIYWIFYMLFILHGLLETPYTTTHNVDYCFSTRTIIRTSKIIPACWFEQGLQRNNTTTTYTP